MFGVRRTAKEFCATLREILDENTRLMAENESLRTENAKLRKLLTDYYNAPCMICNPWAAEHRCKHDDGGMLIRKADGTPDIEDYAAHSEEVMIKKLMGWSTNNRV